MVEVGKITVTSISVEKIEYCKECRSTAGCDHTPEIIGEVSVVKSED